MELSHTVIALAGQMLRHFEEFSFCCHPRSSGAIQRHSFAGRGLLEIGVKRGKR